MSQTFRGKTGEVVEAVRFAASYPNFDEIEAFVGGDAEWRGHLVVATKQGALRANSGDWIVRLPSGEFRAIPHEVFEATYEPTDA